MVKILMYYDDDDDDYVDGAYLSVLEDKENYNCLLLNLDLGNYNCPLNYIRKYISCTDN